MDGTRAEGAAGAQLRHGFGPPRRAQEKLRQAAIVAGQQSLRTGHVAVQQHRKGGPVVDGARSKSAAVAQVRQLSVVAFTGLRV